MPNQADKKDVLKANILMALQEEDDNPYDVSDEMLVAFSEGKLSTQEAKVVARCLAHNPEAMAAAVALSKGHLAQKNSVSNNIFLRMYRYFIDRVDYRQRVTLSGMATASLIAIAIIFMLPKNNYHSLDVAFNDLTNATNKPNMLIVPGSQNESPDAFRYKGKNETFLYGGLRQGLKDGLTAFLTLNEQQFQQVGAIPRASAHCNNAMPLKSCRTIIQQGIYVGKFLAWLHTQCLLNPSVKRVNTDVDILPILNEVDIEKMVVMADLVRMAQDSQFECNLINTHVSHLLMQ